MKPYLVVVYWRNFTWTLRARAAVPATLKGIASHFGNQFPISIQVLPR